jgi:hypothetical protein
MTSRKYGTSGCVTIVGVSEDLVHRLPHRRREAAEPNDLLPDAEDPPRDGAIGLTALRARLLGGDRVLDVIAEVLEPFDHAQVAVHDLVEHQVQEETDPLFDRRSASSRAATWRSRTWFATDQSDEPAAGEQVTSRRRARDGRDRSWATRKRLRVEVDLGPLTQLRLSSTASSCRPSSAWSFVSSSSAGRRRRSTQRWSPSRALDGPCSNGFSTFSAVLVRRQVITGGEPITAPSIASDRERRSDLGRL